MEAADGFEPSDEGFAVLCLTRLGYAASKKQYFSIAKSIIPLEVETVK